MSPPPAGDVAHRALLLARTVRHLRPAQVAHRLRLRTQRAALSRLGQPLAARLRPRHAANAPGWPGAFTPLDAATPPGCGPPEHNAAGRFAFLNDERHLGDPPAWADPGEGQLWRYHLHYLEWAWAFATHPDRAWASEQFRRLWRDWRAATPLGRGDAWSPYVVSLRAWALCGVHAPLVAGTPDADDYLADLALHARFIRAHLEFDVGGNHLVKNLKALAGLGVFLGDDGLVDRALRHLDRQLAVQVLEDGGHFERSPSYHCQVLADLIDVAGLLAATGRPPLPRLDAAIAAMRAWLGAMLMPDGDVPLFNDATLVGTERIAALAPTAAEPGPLMVLAGSGYAVARAGPFHLVVDVGPPCPPELPAHAQADCASFELALDGRRLVVDTATSTYEAGERRAYERSTAAHNTVEIDGADQTEVWGRFRAARRAHPRLEHAGESDGGAGAIVVAVSHDGYERLPGRPRHHRTLRLTPEALEIVDDVAGTGRHHLVARLHLAPGSEITPEGDATFRTGGLLIALAGGDAAQDHAEVAQGFGDLAPTTRLVLSAEVSLPHRLTTTLRRAEHVGTENRAIGPSARLVGIYEGEDDETGRIDDVVNRR